jgi:Metallo-peptidase family M12B Reprolysin-like/Secretion system C-terminal sorting domain/Bacterial pre-peptidase C-terminal domain/Fibronectin type III domain
MKKNFLFVLSFTLITALQAQKNAWSSNTADASKMTKDKAVARQSFPAQFKLFNLDHATFKQQLFSIVGTARRSTVIDLPNANGQLEQFEVYEASNFDTELQARFPEIRSFSGRGINDKTASLKLSYSPQGVQTIVFRTEKETECIEAFSNDHNTYAVFKSVRAKGSLPWSCSTPEQVLTNNLNDQVNNSNIAARSGADLKVMRLAQSVTAEYSNYFGATSASQVSLVLSAVNATLTRCNGVYEKDLALHLNLVSTSTNVFYYNPSTDPYSAAATGSGGAWNSELQTTLTSVIGDANYDIGHLFGASGGGGNAGCIGCVCGTGKGSGFTSPNDAIPQGDNFDIDYVVHEVGHQLGANHTFSKSLEGTGVNKEVGSGITIMGYAGITAQDVAPHSIAYYHEASIAQIQANLATKTCPVTSAITNATPVVNAVSNFTIPISTPFALTGSATDANASDVLTYSWEQNDNATTSGTSSVASATKTTGPNFISFAPSTSPTRLFPKLATILAGSNLSGPLPGGDAGANTEALSSIARTLNFRLTVRDNAPYSSTAPVSVGQTQFTDMAVTVSAASGPFAVTAPNTAVSWNVGTTQNVTWSVNNTTAAPVSCANVKISLSTDGGNTFPTVLVASTPNDGTEAITVPNVNSTTCRIKVEAVGNIFFDIDNANFTITGSAPTCGDATGLNATSITNTSAAVNWTAVTNAVSYTVDYKLSTATAWTNAATATTSTSVAISGLTQGTTYDYRVLATCSAGAGNYAQAQFTTTAPATCNAPTGLASSAITATGATVSWSAVSGAASYDVDYKLNTATVWTNAVTATTATSRAITGLSASSLYDYRVRTNCASLSSAYTQAQFTTAAVSTCPGTYDVSTNGTVAGAATIPFNTDVKGTISASGDVDYYKFVITTGGTATITLTTLPFDYDVKLFSSNGTTQLAISQAGSTTSESISRTYTAGTYYIQVYGYNGANSATSCYTLKVALGTASRQEEWDGLVNNQPKFSIYPNPTSDKVNINITGVKDRATAQVFDLTGKVVRQENITNGNNAINVQTLHSGVYFVKVVDTNGITIYKEKFVKE